MASRSLRQRQWAGLRSNTPPRCSACFRRLHRAEGFRRHRVGLAIVQSNHPRQRGRVWAKAALTKAQPFLFTMGLRLSQTEAPALTKRRLPKVMPDQRAGTSSESKTTSVMSSHAACLEDRHLANSIHVARHGVEALEFLCRCRAEQRSRDSGEPKLICWTCKLPRTGWPRSPQSASRTTRARAGFQQFVLKSPSEREGRHADL